MICVRKIPWMLRVVALCVGSALLAPLILTLFGVEWRQSMIQRGLVYAFTYSLSIGVPSGLVLPVVARRIGGPGSRLALVMAASILLLAAAGGFLAGGVLVLTGYNQLTHFWHDYWANLRITAIMALVFGMGSYFYEALASNLRETRLKLQEKELEQERIVKSALEAKLASLESRIHPHFLFNTLNSISSLIPTDPARAEQMVGRLAALLRSSLDTTRHRFIPLDAELSIVKDYLDIEKARFGERLQYRLTTRTRNISVPPMSIQSLVENAIKHGIATQPGRGEVVVEARQAGSEVRIEVRDSGPGFNLAGVPSGHGLDNLVSRLDTLYGAAARLEVGREDGHCVVTMVVPA